MDAPCPLTISSPVLVVCPPSFPTPSLIGNHTIWGLHISLRDGHDWLKSNPIPHWLRNGYMTQFWTVRLKKTFAGSLQETLLLPLF